MSNRKNNNKAEKNKSGKVVIKGYRLRTRKFFLTYPQLPSSINHGHLKETALSSFELVFKMNRKDFKYVISVELHQDSNPHLHVFLDFGLPQDISSASKLDLKFGKKYYHGNYQAVKSPHATLQYIIKTVENYDLLSRNMELPLYKGRYYSNIHEHLYEILVGEGQKAAVDALYSIYPKESIQRGSTILGNLELAKIYNSTKNERNQLPRYTLADFKEIPEELNEWLESDEPLTLFLYGPSGTGKTVLAKALLHEKNLNSIFIRNKHALKGFSPDAHQAILFDDIDPDEFTREELINLLDTESESQIKILYAYVAIPPKTVRIVTTNRLKSYTKHGEVVSRRIIPVHIEKPQFLLPTRTSSSTDDNLKTIEGEIVKKNKRGRPPGSKNK